MKHAGISKEQLRDIVPVFYSGTFASYPFRRQMMADIFNKPVHIKQGSGSDSVAFGAFLLSATEMGLYKNLDEAAETLKLPDCFLPQQQHHIVYMKHYALFRRLSVKLFDKFESLAELQRNN